MSEETTASIEINEKKFNIAKGNIANFIANGSTAPIITTATIA
jgi:hypothetical protein